MFLILNIILIILINERYAYFTQNCEIIFLPTWNSTEAKELSMTLKVFGKLMQLNLRKSDQALSPVFKIWKNNVKGVTEKLLGLKTSDHCFYFHKDDISSVAINFCQEYGLEGLVLVKNNMLEIRPFRNVYAPLFFVKNFCTKEQKNQSFGTPHLITRSLQYTVDLSVDLDLHHLHKIITKRGIIDQKSRNKEENKAKYAIELAVFVDAEAYHTLLPLLKNNDIKNMHDMIFTYVRQIQNLFHHPSLGVLIDIVLARLEIAEESSSLPINTTNSSTILSTFCQYIRNLNPRNDSDPRHWDIALLITGAHPWTKLFEQYGLVKRGFTKESYFTRACEETYSCALVSLYFEIYDTNDELNSKISILSSRAAHAIGKLIGLISDPKGSYVMTRTDIRTDIMNEKMYLTWSEKTRLSIQSLLKKKQCFLDRNTKSQNYDDHYWSLHAFSNSTCHEYLGRQQTAKAQCESFMHDDKDANVVTLHDICKNLECETPRKNSSIFAKGALNGTYCAFRKECCNGECIPATEPQYIFKYCKKNKWSEWKKDSCKSSCLEKSKGAQIKRRFCEHRGQRTPNCPGPYYDVVLCDDSVQCTRRRWSIAEFTAIRCNEFRNYGKRGKHAVKLLIGSGNQMVHDVEKPWIACTVFCRQKNKPVWYASRQEMLDYNVDPYFPDGTWCHNKDGQDYYCRQHYCLPENYSFVESKK